MAEDIRVENILVGLDLSEMDEHILKYTEMLSNVLSVKTIYFLYVARDLEIPDELLLEYPDLKKPIDEGLEEEISAKISRTCTRLTSEVQVIVQEGHPIETVMKMARVKEVDLIILGRKRLFKGSGILSSHISRKSECSLLLVPEKTEFTLSNILVPVDFSAHSRIALSMALKIAAIHEAKVKCLHVYSVPMGYHTSGKTFEEFSEIMKEHARKDYRKFLREVGTEEIECEYLLHDKKKNQDLIHDYAVEKDHDLIILGSKGRSNAAVLLIGSLAEKVTISDFDIPLMIVKSKGENMGLFEALMRV